PTVRVFVRNSEIDFDRVRPVRVGRRILVPLRGVFEKMGATVTYDARRRRVIATRGNTRAVLPLNGKRATVNGELRALDAYPRVSRGHIVVPIRFVAETLDAGVVYSAPNSTVRIYPH
ncbi:copper amine oxidase N-terminal domain-containing protein, partial [bacterium]